MNYLRKEKEHINKHGGIEILLI